MEVVQKSPEKLVLRLPANESLLNSIRRSVTEILILAIDEVEIFKNDSAIYDEMLAHRLGLIPLKTEKGMSEKTKIELKLSKMGPCTVYASDLSGNADIVEGKIPITLLGNGHKLELVATAVLGRGVEHAKYIAGLCYYRHLQDVTANPEIDMIIQRSKCFIKPEKKGNKWRCDLTDAEIDAILKINREAAKDADEIMFVIESFGQIDAKDIFFKALDVLESNLNEIEKALE